MQYASEMMRQLGFEHFCVTGHDRGGYCAFRMALDYPEKVLKLAVFDNIPIGKALRRITRAFAPGWWHWFFFAQSMCASRAWMPVTTRLKSFQKKHTALWMLSLPGKKRPKIILPG
jgi:pimeloyl-ACP methyl ester carboxylesterase